MRKHMVRLLLSISVVFLLTQCGGRRTGQWCVYEIVAAEGKCPSGAMTKNFCRYCINPCPQNFDTTIITGTDTCYYTLRVIDRTCRECPANSLP